MKLLALVTLLSAALFGALVVPVGSQTTDTVQVTMSPQLTLAASVIQDSVDFLAQPLSPSNTDRRTAVSNAIEVQNLGNGPINLLISGTNAVGGAGNTPWTLNCDPADMGIVGVNQYVLRYWTHQVQMPSDGQAICSASDKTLTSGVQPWVSASSSYFFRLQLNMPTATTGFGQRASTITVTAVQP